MSYANGTTHYNLPQTVGTDKRDWFDSNAAFAAVDAALYAAATGQASDAEAITALQQTVAGQATDIAALQTASSSQAASISALQTTVNGQATQIADVRQDAEDMITANNEGAAATSTRAYAINDYFIYNDVLYKATDAIAIGDTIVPNTNCEATNVDTELTQLNSDLDDLAIETVRTRYIGNLVNFEAMGAQMNGWGFVVDLPTSMDLTISSARFFGDDGQWHNLTTPTIKNSFGKQLVWGDQSSNGATNGKTYLVQLTGTSAKPTV